MLAVDFIPTGVTIEQPSRRVTLTSWKHLVLYLDSSKAGFFFFLVAWFLRQVTFL